MTTRTAVNNSSADDPIKGERGGLLRILAAVAVLVTLFVVRDDIARYIPSFVAWIEGLGIWGPLVFGAGYAAATVAMVPGSLLTLAAGAIFGLGKGFVTVFVAASVGATLAFLVSRYLARSWVEQKLAGNAKFATIDRAIGEEGLKIVFLLRLSPLFPFNLLNYGLGLTGVKLRDYVVAHLGMLPGTLLYVYYGRLAGAVVEVAGGMPEERGAGYYAVLGLGLVATVVVTTIVTRIATRSLRGLTGEQPGVASDTRDSR